MLGSSPTTRISTSVVIGGLLVAGLTACAGGGGATDLVSQYMNALADGNAGLAHEVNPNSPELDAAQTAMYKAADHVSHVKVGGFAKTTDSRAGRTTGVVTVSYQLGGAKRNQTLGLTRADGGKKWRFATVAIPATVRDKTDVFTADGGYTADPAVLPASITLPSSENGVVTSIDVNGTTVDSTDTESFDLPPAVYTIDKATATGSSKYFSFQVPPISPSKIALGGGKSLAVGEPTAAVNEAGKQRVAAVLNEILSTKYQDAQVFGISDNVHYDDRPSSILMSANDFIDDHFTAENTNIYDGAISMTATQPDGQIVTETVGQNDYGIGFTLWAGFSTGSSDWESAGQGFGTNDIPVTIVSKSKTDVVVDVRPDGTFTVSTPGAIKLETSVASVGGADGNDMSDWDDNPQATRFNGNVNLTWSPTGQLTPNGTVAIYPGNEEAD